MLNVIRAGGNIIASLVLGAVLLAFVGVNFPATFEVMIGWATGLKAAIVGTGLDPRYNNWIRLMLEERQLLFMFFTVAARVVMALIWWLLPFGRSS